MKKFHIYNLELEDVFKKKMKNNKKKNYEWKSIVAPS